MVGSQILQTFLKKTCAMKFNNLETVFTFGKFEGNTLLEVVELQPSYLDWCAINLDHFYITKSVIEELSGLNPDFALTNEGQ